MKRRTMNRAWLIGGVMVGAVSCLLYFHWRHDAPRRRALVSLRQFSGDLSSGSSTFLDRIVIPDAVRSRTSNEQLDFIRKSLQDEISDAGLTLLKKQGVFGSLKEVFPKEAETWSRQAGVSPEKCVAFKMEQNGLRSEIVLFAENQTYKVVRCNNVKQMAAAKF